MTTQQNNEWGDIPQGWEVVILEEIADFGSGTTPARHSYDRYFNNGQNYWVKTLDLNNSIITNTEEKVTDFALKETSLKSYPMGTVLVAMYGGFNQIGRTGLLAISASINQALVAIQPYACLNSEYLLHNLNFNIEYWKTVASSSRKDPNITSNDVKKYKLLLPPKPEQTAIATVLSDTDKWIDSLTALIAKKQAIKSATMSQLLSGQKRLPQFANHPDGTPKTYIQTDNGKIPEDWEVVALGDLAFIKTGSKNNQDKQDNGQYPFFVRSATVERINSYSYDCEAILIPGEGGIGNIFHYINGKFDAHQRVYVIRDFNDVSGKFIFYVLKQFFGKYALENSVKATVDSLRLPTFQNFQFAIPKSTTEQTAIAQILSDMDSEIIALENRLNKTKALKQGLMHQLLTGKIRLGKN